MTLPASDADASTSLSCGTGIRGLDDILAGGLPANRLYLVRGAPGTGKTTLALQFLLEGRRCGERGLYITLSDGSARFASSTSSRPSRFQPCDAATERNSAPVSDNVM